ncbi:hypothetical protein [Hymenobacter edaphi]|uniref:Uncharacterized protein n=1 Tax=Hymenobacter edaphi TaxID=2211146 RepID=A0A328BME0_9BACT|nr:hypothetical protein [Hymenobacter edaphi]RAK66168.1 hypothetical protein DLM85_15865 [Hymenobacter edaphi]
MAAKSQQPQPADEQPRRDASDRPDAAQENNNTEGGSTAMLNRETHGQIMARNTADRLYSDGSDETATPRPPTLSDDTAGFDPTNRSH